MLTESAMPPCEAPAAMSAVGQVRVDRPHQPGLHRADGDQPDHDQMLRERLSPTLREFLHQHTPEVAFLGEEAGNSGGDQALTWTLDPIDGTANFIHGIPLCAVSLGLLHGSRAVLGVIDLPMLGLRYTAIDGGGAFENGRQIHASTTQHLHDAVIAIGDYAVGENASPRNERRLALTAQLSAKAQRVRMFGSAAIDLAWVAAGRLDGSIMLSNTAWDTTAGVVLAREAGAIVVDEHGAAHTPQSTTTIAATLQLREELLAIIATTKRD